MYAGVDVGCTLIKVVIKNHDREESTYLTYSKGNWREDKYKLSSVIAELSTVGVRAVGVSGAGADAFIRQAQKVFAVTKTEGDELSHEIIPQARGVRHLLKNQGETSDEFLLVSIGSGVSFTRVCGDEIELYEPGLSMGGGFIAAQAALAGVSVTDIDSVSREGKDLDLLMKHIFPKMKWPKGEYVVASMGRLPDSEFTEADICYTAMKTVVVQVLGYVSSIRKDEAWHLGNRIVFIGTPVDKFTRMHELLRVYSLALGLKGILPEHGQYACALGALEVCMERYQQKGDVLPPAGLTGRLKAGVSRRVKLAKAILNKG
jgi:type II pantothenate kinase